MAGETCLVFGRTRLSNRFVSMWTHRRAVTFGNCINAKNAKGAKNAKRKRSRASSPLFLGVLRVLGVLGDSPQGNAP